VNTTAHTTVSSAALAPAVLVLVLIGPGCGDGGGKAQATDPVAESMLDLDYWEFDQGLDTGWRPYAQGKEYERAADFIDHYLAHRGDLVAAQRAYLHLHAGQLRAYHGDDTRALAHLDQAYVIPDSMPDRFPRSFNALAAGTRAFMRGDMAGVRAAVEEIRNMPAMSARDSMFLEGMELLATQEGKSYREAMPVD
jgi:hypothetical protein